jgi:hypothetical protein
VDQQHTLLRPPIPEIDRGIRTIPLKEDPGDQAPDGIQGGSPAAYPLVGNVRHDHVQDTVWNPAGRHAPPKFPFIFLGLALGTGSDEHRCPPLRRQSSARHASRVQSPRSVNDLCEIDWRRTCHAESLGISGLEHLCLGASILTLVGDPSEWIGLP